MIPVAIRTALRWVGRRLSDDVAAVPRDRGVEPIVWLIHAGFVTLTVLPLVITRFPPMEDYYQWMFHGHLVAQLLPWGPAADSLASAAYELHWGPTPNLAAPLIIGTLSTWLAAPLATRIFTLLGVLTFALGFASLVRSVHRRPTIVEFFGYAWAYGYMTYQGYLSNIFGLGLAFFVIAKVYRTAVHDDEGPGWVGAALLALTGAGVYLAHIFGWLTFVAVALSCALRLALRRRSLGALQLVVAVAPSVLWLAWYAIDVAGGVEPEIYETLADKAVSIVIPPLLFMRTDPFPQLFSVPWSNAIAALVVIGALLANRPRDGRLGAGPLVLAGSLLALAALADPFAEIADATRPDGRLTISALLLLLGSIRCSAFDVRRGLPAAVLLSLVLGYHVVEFRRAGGYMEEIRATADRTVPPGAPTYSLTVWRESSGGACEPRLNRFGVRILKRFDLQRFLETGGVYTANLAETALVRYKRGWERSALHSTTLYSLERLKRLPIARWQAEWFPLVEIMGCPEDVRAVRRLLKRKSDVVEETGWVTVLRSSSTDPPPRKSLTPRARN